MAGKKVGRKKKLAKLIGRHGLFSSKEKVAFGPNEPFSIVKLEKLLKRQGSNHLRKPKFFRKSFPK